MISSCSRNFCQYLHLVYSSVAEHSSIDSRVTWVRVPPEAAHFSLGLSWVWCCVVLYCVALFVVSYVITKYGSTKYMCICIYNVGMTMVFPHYNCKFSVSVSLCSFVPISLCLQPCSLR